MVRRDKTRPGRVTPARADVAAGSSEVHSGVSRVPVKVGGRFQTAVPFLMFGLMGVGLLVILLNYLITAFGAPSNWYLLGGLGLVLAGIVMATQYR